MKDTLELPFTSVYVCYVLKNTSVKKNEIMEAF